MTKTLLLLGGFLVTRSKGELLLVFVVNNFAFDWFVFAV